MGRGENKMQLIKLIKKINRKMMIQHAVKMNSKSKHAKKNKKVLKL